MTDDNLEIECLDSTSPWQAVADEWDALARRYPRPNVVLTQAWLAAAWSYLATGRELRVLLVRRQKRLVGALALAIELVPWRGRQLRTLVLLTDPITMNVRSDLLVEPGCERPVLAAIAGHLRRTCTDWIELRLDSVPADSPLRGDWREFARQAGLQDPRDELWWRLQCLPVRGSWEEYLATHSRSSHDQFRKERRRIEPLGELTVEFATSPADVAAGVETFFEVESRSGKEQRDDYTPLSPALKAYYRTQFAGLAQHGRAVVVMVRQQGRAIGCDLAGRLDDHIITFNEVSDLELRQNLVGHYMRSSMIRWAWDSGAREFDFNGYGGHIERWRGHGADFHRLGGCSPSPAGRLLALHRRCIVPLARRLLPDRFLGKSVATRPGDRGLPVETPMVATERD